nr:MAG TPA: hypothetical protein [Bacteriophage sp.]
MLFFLRAFLISSTACDNLPFNAWFSRSFSRTCFSASTSLTPFLLMLLLQIDNLVFSHFFLVLYVLYRHL